MKRKGFIYSLKMTGALRFTTSTQHLRLSPSLTALQSITGFSKTFTCARFLFRLFSVLFYSSVGVNIDWHKKVTKFDILKGYLCLWKDVKFRPSCQTACQGMR